MGAGDEIQPGADAWVAAIHATEEDPEPSGSGIVLDELRILTCYHVVRELAEQWVAFPKARGDASLIRRRAERVILPKNYGDLRDLAILVLAEPIPHGVTAAPLRFPEPTALFSKQWWAFGFPADPLGSSAYGQVGDTLGHGWVRLHRASPDPVEYGFSGGGLWCPDYQGVVGIVGQAKGESGGGRAMTLNEASQWFPGQDLSDLAADWERAKQDYLAACEGDRRGEPKRDGGHKSSSVLNGALNERYLRELGHALGSIAPEQFRDSRVSDQRLMAARRALLAVGPMAAALHTAAETESRWPRRYTLKQADRALATYHKEVTEKLSALQKVGSEKAAKPLCDDLARGAAALLTAYAQAIQHVT